MATIEKLPLTSMSITEEQLEKLKSFFPEVFTEGGKVDWNKLKLTLGETVDIGKERFGMTWPGKADCFKTIQQPSIATLVPDGEESVDFDQTDNLFIEGDNLEVLKLLQKSYLGKVKMIYIDPPYNTGHDFVYPDDYGENLSTYLEYTGQTDGEGRKFATNPETDGRFHSKWMNMMYPRLFLAKNILREDGVTFISIDDNEVHNLKAICNEIFGEENFVSQLVWEKKKKGTFLSHSISNVKEYILVYSKRRERFNGLIGQINYESETYPCINASNKREIRRIPAGIRSNYKEPNYILEKGEVISVSTMDLILHSDLIIENRILKKDLVIEGNWRYTQKLMEEYALKHELYITQDLYLRRNVTDPRQKTLKDILPRVEQSADKSNKLIDINNLFKGGWGSNEDGEEELRLLMEAKALIDFPKPRKLIEKLIACVRDEEAIVLDFFAGSATTAHAVLDLNKEDGGHRKFICIQLPEPTDEKSEAFKAGYKTIADISKERIRRVIQKIKEEQAAVKKKKAGELSFVEKENGEPMDLGFKVFKLEPSNFKVWSAGVENTPAAIQQKLYNHIQHIAPKAEREAILYELVLKSGFKLTTKIEPLILAGKTVYNIAEGELLICLDKKLTNEVIKAMAERKPNRVICLDEGFQNNDQLKTNAVQIMKSKRVVNFRTV